MKSVAVFWSLQSPYCWFLADRLHALSARADVDVVIKPVRPGVLRLPDAYRDRPEIEQRYFDADTLRTAKFLRVDYGPADPSPVEFIPGTWIAAAKQPRIDHLNALFVAACAAGLGLTFVDTVVRLIWDGGTPGWDRHLDAAVAPLGLQTGDDCDAVLTTNESEMYAAGHWGVPLMVYRGEPFYGQDRFDQLLWRIGLDERDGEE